MKPFLLMILAWLLPGAGHIYLGHKARGLLIFLVIAATFWTGVILGGVEMVRPRTSTPWFVAQILAGAPGLIAYVLQNPNLANGVGRGLEWGQVYSGIAGLLNLLCVLDVVLRTHGIVRSNTGGHI